MSKGNTSMRLFALFTQGNAQQQDAAVLGVMRRYNGRLVNVGTGLATMQRTNIYDVSGTVDQVMCLELDAELTQALGQPVKVTTRFEEAALGKLSPDLFFETSRLRVALGRGSSGPALSIAGASAARTNASACLLNQFLT
jgi:hypothetical protein